MTARIERLARRRAMLTALSRRQRAALWTEVGYARRALERNLATWAALRAGLRLARVYRRVRRERWAGLLAAALPFVLSLLRARRAAGGASATR
jgi:hypothetical protein